MRPARCLVILVLLASFTSWTPRAYAQEPEEQEIANGEVEAPAVDTEVETNPLGDANNTVADTVDLAIIAGANSSSGEGADDVGGSIDEQPAIVVEPNRNASRARTDVADSDPPCAEWGYESSAPLVGNEQAAPPVDTTEDHNNAILAHIVDLNNDAEPTRSTDHKPAKSPLQQQRTTSFLLQEPVDVDAVHELLLDIQATADAAIDALTTLVTGPTLVCLVEYRCGAERVDDFISGRIDSEPSGAYADYVAGVAGALDVSTAVIREIESNPVLSTGETPPSINAPSSEAGIQSLTSVLADRGLGESPEGLFAPIFNYCRIGEGGPIEIDNTVADFLLPTFNWSPLVDEFDIDGASTDIIDAITETLRGELPVMRTTPPMDTGATIVQFPMWLWLDDPFLETSEVAISDLATVRVQGQAQFDHVTWTLGDFEVSCTLEQMQAWIPDTNLNPADPPDCHHIFRQLTTYTPTASVTYRIEQDVAQVPAPGYPWPAANWQPHPTTPFVTVSNTGPEITVHEIRSVNVPQDYGTD